MEEITPVQLPNVEETCDPKEHPLKNSVILKTLFELIPFEFNDFKSFRLVSRTWKNVSLSTWRKSATIYLHQKYLIDRQDDKSVTDDSKHGKISWQKYLELLENNEHKLVQHPFRKYSLYFYKFDLQSVNQNGEQDQLRFWNKTGPVMTHLTLNFCEFAGVADFRTVLFEKTPNLQSLFFFENMYPNERPATKAQRLDPKLPQHTLIPPEQVQNNLKEFNVRFIRNDNENEVADEDENDDTDEDENEVGDEDQNELADEDENEVGDEDQNELADEDENEVGDEDQNELADEDENEVGDEDQNELADEDENEDTDEDENEDTDEDENEDTDEDENEDTDEDENEDTDEDENEDTDEDENEVGDDQNELADEDENEDTDEDENEVGDDQNELADEDENEDTDEDENEDTDEDENEDTDEDENEDTDEDENEDTDEDENEDTDEDENEVGDEDENKVGDEDQNEISDEDQNEDTDEDEIEVAGEDDNEDTDEDENEVADEGQNELADEDENELSDEDENEDTDEDENEDTDEDENEVADEDENEVADEDENEVADEGQNEVADEDENEVADEAVDETVKIFPNPTGSRFPITWMEFLIHFPNIKRFGGITLCGMGAFRLGTEADFLEFFETVEILRREHGSRYLADLDDLDLVQDFESSSDFGRQLYSTINRLNFPFQRLSFQVDKTVDEETFKQLLQHPLKYLAVERTKYVNYEVRPFQNFPFGLNFFALKELGMWGPIAPNLVFLKKCPNLEKFTYSPISGNRLDDFNLTQGLGDIYIKLEKLKRLCMHCDKCNAEEIRKLGELMPNVTDLEVGLDDESFSAVCKVWKNLEYLRIESWKIGEEALLGKDKQSGENFRHPNLTDLKKLKAFVMERFRKESDQQGFTGAMILDGILALPKLEKVCLIVSSEVSSRVLNQLKMAIPKCYITIQKETPRVGDEFAMAAAQFQQNRTDNP